MIKLLDLDLDDILIGEVSISEVKLGTIKIWPNGGGGQQGESDQPYVPGELEPDSDVIFIDEPGAPEVVTDSEGNVTEYTMTDVSGNNPVTMDGESEINTGFIPFKGNDWELFFRFRYKYTENIGIIAVPISASKWVDGVLNSGFALRLSNPKKSSGQYDYYRPYVTHIDNGSTESEYLYLTSSRGAVFNDNVEFYIHMKKIGSTISFEITANSIRFNPTGTSTSGARTETDSTRSLVWNDYSESEIDIKIGGQLNSAGEVINRATITVLEFSVKNI